MWLLGRRWGGYDGQDELTQVAGRLDGGVVVVVVVVAAGFVGDIVGCKGRDTQW